MSLDGETYARQLGKRRNEGHSHCDDDSFQQAISRTTPSKAMSQATPAAKNRTMRSRLILGLLFWGVPLGTPTAAPPQPHGTGRYGAGPRPQAAPVQRPLGGQDRQSGRGAGP